MVAPRPMHRERLTGATRGRPRRIFSTLILQVEVLVESSPWAAQIPAPWHSSLHMSEAEWLVRQATAAAEAWRPSRRYWRDASWDDQLELARMELSQTIRRRADDPPATSDPEEPAADP
jgi:hypothetical protein